MIVFGNRDDARAIATRAQVSFDPTFDVVIASVTDGTLDGGIIYTGFTDSSVYIHIAAFKRYWLCRDLIWVGLDYPFRQLSKKRVFGTVPETNHRSARLAVHFGFEEITRIPGRYANGSGDIVYAIDYERAKPWLRIKPRTLKVGV